jgi:hypothetical protein
VSEHNENNKGFPIFIDEVKFDASGQNVTGDYLRGLPPVPDDYDLWQIL